MQFDCDKELTLDDSAEIMCYSGQELVFQFYCNMKELNSLQEAITEGKKIIQDEEDLREVQKTKAFWKGIKKDQFFDVQPLLKEYRDKKAKGIKMPQIKLPRRRRISRRKW